MQNQFLVLDGRRRRHYQVTMNELVWSPLRKLFVIGIRIPLLRRKINLGPVGSRWRHFTTTVITNNSGPWNAFETPAGSVKRFREVNFGSYTSRQYPRRSMSVPTASHSCSTKDRASRISVVPRSASTGVPSPRTFGATKQK